MTKALYTLSILIDLIYSVIAYPLYP